MTLRAPRILTGSARFGRVRFKNVRNPSIKNRRSHALPGRWNGLSGGGIVDPVLWYPVRPDTVSAKDLELVCSGSLT
jgi:hypothetical protein